VPAFGGERECDPKSVPARCGEWGRPTGTFEERDQASDLLRRESECCCRNWSGLLRRKSEWSQKEKIETHAITTLVSDV
jgi:hypothetical protein